MGKNMRHVATASVGFFIGALWFWLGYTVLPQHRVAVALEACFKENEPHAVTRLTWDVWASNPHKYSIGAPLYIQSKMTPLGALTRLCMYEQLDPEGYDKTVRGQR